MTTKSIRADDSRLPDRRVRKTRHAIRLALRTLLQENGIDQITIKDIAEKADIGYTTFFRHFPTKEAAIADLVDSAAAELLDETLPLLSPDDGLASTLALCSHVNANRHVWEALLTGGAANFVRVSLATHTSERSTLWPPMQSWLPADKGIFLATGMVVETLTWWLTHAPELSPDQVSQIMNHTFISALLGLR